MSLGDILFATGFDDRDPGVFDITGSAGNAYGAPAAGTRTPQSLYALQGNNADHYATLRVPSSNAAAPVSEVAFGIGIVGTTDQNHFIGFRSPNGTENMQVGFSATGKLTIMRNGTVLATGPTTITTGAWAWVMGYFLISDTVGKYYLRLNNVDEIALTTGQDTRADAAAGGDTVDAVCVARSINFWVDDVYVLDATGTTNNSADIDIGEVTIPYLTPNAAGDVTGFTRGGTDSGANWSQVDETPPNDDTDYVLASVNTTTDLYNLTDIANANAVKGIVIRTRAKKDTAGAKSFRQVLKSQATLANGPDLALGTTYQTFGRSLRKNPVSAVDFTLADITALQAGQEVR